MHEYINDGLSLTDLVVKYNIPTTSTVNKWISKYLSGKILKTYSPKPEVYQLKYKSLTFEDRVEIVDYYMNHGQSYKTTANHFNINYSQVYNWVKKYNLHGYDGLKDGRGKGKPQSVLTPEEALKAEIKILKEKNKFLQMENDVLKKEEEIERKLMKQASDKKHHTKR